MRAQFFIEGSGLLWRNEINGWYPMSVRRLRMIPIMGTEDLGKTVMLTKFGGGTLLPGERAGVPRRIVKWRAALIFVETALALALLSGSGIFLKDYINRSKVDWGFNTENLLMLNVARVSDNVEALNRNRIFYDEVLERMRAIPGVRFASCANNLDWAPRSGSIRMHFETNDIDGNTLSTWATYHTVASDFFAAVGF